MNRRISIGIAGPDMQQMASTFGTAGTDERFTLAFMQNNWSYLADQIKGNEPDLLIVYADIAPKPDALRDLLSRLTQAVVVVLLPPAWGQIQGMLEQIHTVRRVFILPTSPVEVLNVGFSAVQTEYAKRQSAAPLQQMYAGGPRSAGAVGTRVIAFVSSQGGVGRSTLAEALGFEITARRNIRTLLFSFDLPSPAPLRLGLRYVPNASEFFARPEGGIQDAVQSTPDGLDVVIAPPDTYAYAQAVDVERGAANSIRSLVMSSYMLHYGAILLDLPDGESTWMMQALLAANTVVIVSRPTLEGIKATAHIAQLITEKLVSDHRIPKEGIFVALNQRTPKTAFTPTQFSQEGATQYGWFPPVLATIDYDPAVSQAQDAGRPAASVSEALGKGAQVLADAFYAGVVGEHKNGKGKGFRLGNLVKVNVG